MVRGCVVTLQTRVVIDVCAIDSQSRYMTDFAALSQHSMGSRKRTCAVNFLTVGAQCRKPSDCHDRHQNRQPKLPSSKGMRLSEILQIDPLRQFFGGSDASQHVFSQYRSAITACTAPRSNNA